MKRTLTCLVPLALAFLVGVFVQRSRSQDLAEPFVPTATPSQNGSSVVQFQPIAQARNDESVIQFDIAVSPSPDDALRQKLTELMEVRARQMSADELQAAIEEVEATINEYSSTELLEQAYDDFMRRLADVREKHPQTKSAERAGRLIDAVARIWESSAASEPDAATFTEDTGEAASDRGP